MITLNKIASYVPDNYLSNNDRLNDFNVSPEFIANKLGISQVSRKLSNQDTSDLCVKAFAALQMHAALSISEVDCIVVCTQNPDRCGIPHTSAIVHGKLGGHNNCAVFDVSLGCSGYVYTLSIIKSFMEANGFKKGLLFTSDPYSKIIDQSDKNTAMLFGDAATVTLLEDSVLLDRENLWVPTKFIFSSNGKEGKVLNNDSGQLMMNGREVFNFSATEVPPQIDALLQSVKLEKQAVDLFLFHQGSKFIIDTLIRRLKLPAEKVPSNLNLQGNTVSSSIPLLLERCLATEQLENIVLCGFGVGLSWASCILQKSTST